MDKTQGENWSVWFSVRAPSSVQPKSCKWKWKRWEKGSLVISALWRGPCLPWGPLWLGPFWAVVVFFRCYFYRLTTRGPHVYSIFFFLFTKYRKNVLCFQYIKLNVSSIRYNIKNYELSNVSLIKLLSLFNF